jgi:hypothetical protein
MSQKPAAPRQSRKRPYRTPALTVHGDLKAITAAKAGTGNDGGGKPRTKLSGAST